MFAAEFEAARLLARRAGRVAMRRYGSTGLEHRFSGSRAKTADRASHVVIFQGLREMFPADAILSKGSQDSGDRVSARRVWIVNPLDGSEDFLAQTDDFSVMIGFAVNGEAAVGVVYRPGEDVLYAEAHRMGAWVERDGAVSEIRRTQRVPEVLRIAAARSNDPAAIERILAGLDATLRLSGSLGIPCTLIAEAECDLYMHSGPHLREWDTCASEVIVTEAGGTVTDFRGERLSYNKPDSYQRYGLLACAPGVPAVAVQTVMALTEPCEWAPAVSADQTTL